MARIRILSIAVLSLLMLGACSQHSPYKPDPSMVAKSATEEKEQRHDNQRLAGVEWRWEKFGDPVSVPLTIDDPEKYTLAFLPDGMLHVRADCNRTQGVYAADQGSLQVAFGPFTFAECAAESLGEGFVQKLNNVVGYFFQGDRLYLEMLADGGTLRFVAKQ